MDLVEKIKSLTKKAFFPAAILLSLAFPLYYAKDAEAARKLSQDELKIAWTFNLHRGSESTEEHLYDIPEDCVAVYKGSKLEGIYAFRHFNHPKVSSQEKNERAVVQYLEPRELNEPYTKIENLSQIEKEKSGNENAIASYQSIPSGVLPGLVGLTLFGIGAIVKGQISETKKRKMLEESVLEEKVNKVMHKQLEDLTNHSLSITYSNRHSDIKRLMLEYIQKNNRVPNNLNDYSSLNSNLESATENKISIYVDRFQNIRFRAKEGMGRYKKGQFISKSTALTMLKTSQRELNPRMSAA